MKAAIPCMDDSGLSSQVCGHFGHTPFFTLVDTDSETVTAVANAGHQADRTPAHAVAEMGAQVVLCSGMGHRAVHLLAELGVQAFMGAQGTVGETVQAWQDGRLAPASDETACQGH